MKKVEGIKITMLGITTERGATIIDCAWQFQSKLMIENEDRRVNAKSLMSLMGLTLERGDVITIIADGEDEDEAIRLFTKAFQMNFAPSVVKEIKEHGKK